MVGAGPAGLMAAEVLADAGIQVDVYDAMPSVGRKLLLAGIGGLNITHSEDYSTFATRYGQQQTRLQPMLDQFTPAAFRDWVHALGVDTFVGSSGRVFPKEMKAAPLLRAWLHRLRGKGVQIHARHRWLGWDAQNQLVFQHPQGTVKTSSQATVLALGGASWPKLGSDGAWVPLLADKGLGITALESANCGFEVSWSNLLRARYAGTPLKNVALGFHDITRNPQGRIGELIVGKSGVEGSLIYAYAREIRQVINAQGHCKLFLDLIPAKSQEKVRLSLGQQRGGHSLSNFLKKKLGISGLKVALLHEVLGPDQLNNLDTLAATLKALPIVATHTTPIAEAISTAGGVQFESLNGQLMASKLPGTFIAGEMLDWEAPTGGYLLTACMATGLVAGQGAVNWLVQA